MSYTELLESFDRPFGRLFGAEGDDDTDESQEDVDNQDDDGDDDQEPAKTYDEAYVKQLRSENAQRRTAAKEQAEEMASLKARIAEIEQAEMDDLEKAQAQLEGATTKADEAEARALTAEAGLAAAQIELAVTLEAGALSYNDPGDALSMIDHDGLLDEEGEINTKTVKARLKALAESKPYLIGKPGAGSGDGGPKNPPPGDETREERRKRFHKELTQDGSRV